MKTVSKNLLRSRIYVGSFSEHESAHKKITSSGSAVLATSEELHVFFADNSTLSF